MTPKEAAMRLNISYASVLHHIKKTGLLKAEMNGHHRWQIDPESVAMFPPERPKSGRPVNPDTLGPAEHGKRHIYLGPDISLADVIRIRQALDTGTRAAILLRLAELAETDKENFKRTLADLGINL